MISFVEASGFDLPWQGVAGGVDFGSNPFLRDKQPSMETIGDFSYLSSCWTWRPFLPVYVKCYKNLENTKLLSEPHKQTVCKSLLGVTQHGVE